jgi:RNA-binding protein 23/39
MRSRDRTLKRSRSESVDETAPNADRDNKTLFVSQLVAKVTESMLEDFFGQVSTVTKVRMTRDRNTRKHKGFAYVEMSSEDCIKDCILFNNVIPDFQKFPILVKALTERPATSSSPTNKEQHTVITMAAPPPPPPDAPPPTLHKLLVRNIVKAVEYNQFLEVLKFYGEVASFVMHLAHFSKNCKFAIVGYTSEADMEKAHKALNEFNLAGMLLEVLTREELDAQGIVFDTDLELVQQEVNDHEPDWKPDSTSIGDGIGSAMPTKCLRLSNMFNPAEETDPEWDKDIEIDVKEECEKLGSVTQCKIDAVSSEGIIYVSFTSAETAVKAKDVFHGRFFGGKVINAMFMNEEAMKDRVREINRK